MNKPTKINTFETYKSTYFCVSTIFSQFYSFCNSANYPEFPFSRFQHLSPAELRRGQRFTTFLTNKLRY
ncbi:hypothetical protein DSAG12_04265 [Promethearchaeum syntrophicum]|uniref:Uncharacterized protein n=1 Tax=Promethearchaeum syntrophicum TaxID=2594042 RepID=A0AC61ZTZ2_9ARCH|nr:hypothetical protein [Candidatus Prometheoarchaeum syntrophicum]